MSTSRTTPFESSDAPEMSPALSATSYEVVSSARSRSPSVLSQRPAPEDNSDDEIVWDVAESSGTDSDGQAASQAVEDGEYVLLDSATRSLPSSPKTKKKRSRKETMKAHTPTVRFSETEMEALSLTDKTQEDNAESKELIPLPQPDDAATQRAAEKRRKRRAKKQRRKAAAALKPPVSIPKVSLPLSQEWHIDKAAAVLPSTGLGDRAIVDDFSDTHSVLSFNGNAVAQQSPSLYEEAATYISSFLSNPDAKNDATCRLTLLQSLIIELGLSVATPSLPDTLKSARAFLKAHAFLNIREYLRSREDGPEAVQRAMFPSRSALVKDIKRKRDYISLKWVKQHGLQVLLVGVMYR